MTRNHMLGLLVCCGLAALAWPLLITLHLRVVYNASDSVPRGWYRIIPAHSLPVGSIVLVTLPADVSMLAAQRGYLPERVPLLKRVAAVAPQQVCIAQQRVTIDGAAVATVLMVDSQGRTLPAWQQCRALREGELLLLSDTHPASFDSRYFGPIPPLRYWVRHTLFGLEIRHDLASVFTCLYADGRAAMLHIARTSTCGCHAAPVQYRMFHVSLSFATILKTNAGQDKRSRHHGALKALSARGLARHALAETSCRKRRSQLAPKRRSRHGN